MFFLCLQNFRRKGFYFHDFLIPKTKGHLRPILTLHQVNNYLKKIKVRVVTLASIIPSLDSGDWYAALDLSDAY